MSHEAPSGPGESAIILFRVSPRTRGNGVEFYMLELPGGCFLIDSVRVMLPTGIIVPLGGESFGLFFSNYFDLATSRRAIRGMGHK